MACLVNWGKSALKSESKSLEARLILNRLLTLSIAIGVAIFFVFDGDPFDFLSAYVALQCSLNRLVFFEEYCFVLEFFIQVMYLNIELYPLRSIKAFP